MRFYTNVQLVGNNFLVRGYENGKHFMTRETFSPTLFVSSNKKTKYKTLAGEHVEPINPGSVRDCREFFKSCLLYTSPSPRDKRQSRMPSSA